MYRVTYKYDAYMKNNMRKTIKHLAIYPSRILHSYRCYLGTIKMHEEEKKKYSVVVRNRFYEKKLCKKTKLKVLECNDFIIKQYTNTSELYIKVSQWDAEWKNIADI